MDVFDDYANWKFSAAGKHPAAPDFFRLGEARPPGDELFSLIDTAYSSLTAKAGTAPEFSSWRFWARGAGRDTLICGILRESSDKMGRPYPLLVIGRGPLKDWENRWDLLPFACENTWVQFEYLATQKLDNVKKLEEGLMNTRPPSDAWADHAARRKSLNEIGSPRDPYASFLDFEKLSMQAAEQTGRDDFFVRLDRGPCNDKILQVSLWHHLFKTSAKTIPQMLFMGGTLEKAFLAVYNRPLKLADLVQLWSASTPTLWKNMIGTEYAMDLSTLGKEPISQDRPAGSDVRYDPAFQEMQDEIDKLTSPSAVGSVNWEKILRFSSDILAHKSKDLMVAAYLACALIYTRQHDGVAIGVKILADLMTKFWDDLYPAKERMRGRLRSIEWWVEKTDLALKQLSPAVIPAEQMDILFGHLDMIEQCMRQHLVNAPSLRGIRDYLRSLKTPRETKHHPEDSVKSSTAVRVTAQSQPTSETVEYLNSTTGMDRVESPQLAGRLLDQHLQKLREIAGQAWIQDSANPLPYRINRTTVWCGIEDLPPAIHNRTRIPAPDHQVIKMLFDLRNAGDAEALLKAAEGRVPQYVLWLDLSRFSAEALARLGGKYRRAYHAVCQETAYFVHRLPGLDDLTFADGTPFANPETQCWLKSIALSAGSDGEAVSQTRQRSNEPMSQDIAEIQGMILKGKWIEGMEILQKKLTAAQSSREKILWRMAFAQLMLDIRQPRWALPQLEQIIRDIDLYRLEDYDPMLALRGLKIAWQGMDAQNDERMKAKATDILHRIACIDMAEMIRLGKN